MTNEEKAQNIAMQCMLGIAGITTRQIVNSAAHLAAIEMARFKDKQFKDILKQKFALYHKQGETSIEPNECLLWEGKEDAIGLLLLELFGEDSIDYSDRDE